MAPDVSAQIAELPGFSRQQLLDLWLKLYDRTAPPGIRRELMIPFLACLAMKAFAFQAPLSAVSLNPPTRAREGRVTRSLRTRLGEP